MSFFPLCLLKWKFKWPSRFWVQSHLKCFEHGAAHWSSKRLNWITLELFRKEGWEETSRHEEKYQCEKGKRVTGILHFLFESIFIFEKHMLTEMKRCIHWLFSVSGGVWGFRTLQKRDYIILLDREHGSTGVYMVFWLHLYSLLLLAILLCIVAIYENLNQVSIFICLLI